MIIEKNAEREAKARALTLGAFLAGLTAACLLVAAALLVSPALAETTFAVDRTDDPDPATATACTTTAPNDCSLRGAIVAANSATGADTISVPDSATPYTLTRAGANEDAASTGDLDVTGDLTITGAGARTTTVAGGAAPYDDRIFEIQPGVKATITGLTITGGKADFSGGVSNYQGDLTLREVTVKENTANGNGVGGIFSKRGTLNLIDSTVSGNSATTLGGLYQVGGTANITNSTISGNETTSQAGFSSGVVADEAALINIRNSTIASNTSSRLGGGIMTTTGATVLVKNTIVAGNTQDNCDTAQFGGAISSQGNNISTDDSCPFTKTTDEQDTNPLLGPLQDNGGPTDTRALLSGSPAIDAGTNTDCPAADQRGVTRPQGLRCDIGAFERPNSAPSARDNSYRGKEDRTLKVRPKGVLANDTDPDGDTLQARVVSRPKKGTLSLNPNGSFSYKPPRNFKGSVGFVYRASDGRGASDTATVTIRVVRN